jgi:glycosyltransferase involved in cell wall biosynthesis
LGTDDHHSDHPRVSVITIFLDGEAFLADAVESVLAQTYDNWELLLVDDGSGPAAATIARTYAGRFPNKIRYLEHPGHDNRGMSVSRNLGIRHARGEFIAFIDADDVWSPPKLAEQIAELDAHPEVGMVCGTVVVWHEGTGRPDEILPVGHRQDAVIFPPDAVVAVFPLGPAQAACPSSIVVRSDLVRRLGGFEDQFVGFLEDQAFFCKVYLNAPVFFSNRARFKWRRHPGSCVAIVEAEGSYDRLRLGYLEWFESYLGAVQDVDPRVTQALAYALRYYRRPRIHFLLSLPTKVRNRCRRLGSLFGRLIWRQAS